MGHQFWPDANPLARLSGYEPGAVLIRTRPAVAPGTASLAGATNVVGGRSTAGGPGGNHGAGKPEFDSAPRFQSAAVPLIPFAVALAAAAHNRHRQVGRAIAQRRAGVEPDSADSPVACSAAAISRLSLRSISYSISRHTFVRDAPLVPKAQCGLAFGLEDRPRKIQILEIVPGVGCSLLLTIATDTRQAMLVVPRQIVI
jgi:hypothetical protein